MLNDGPPSPIRNAWYVATSSAAIPRGGTLAKTIMGEPILFGRDARGRAFAFADFCPHRGIPLRFGKFNGDEIQCRYHGWTFNSAGTCTLVPALIESQRTDLGKIKLRPYPLTEVQGHIWVFIGDDVEHAAPVPRLPELGDAVPKLTKIVMTESDIDNAVIGLMDPAHGPFVHRSWFWRTGKKMHDKTKHFVPSPWGFTMVRHPPSAHTIAYWALGGKPQTEIAFHLPSCRWEHIKVGDHIMCHLTALTPISERETEIIHSIYWTQPWLTPLKPLMHPFVSAFLKQDVDAISQQKIGLLHNPPLLLLGEPDALARWYVRLKNEYIRAQAEARAFVNPLKPRTLHWRT